MDFVFLSNLDGISEISLMFVKKEIEMEVVQCETCKKFIKKQMNRFTSYYAFFNLTFTIMTIL